MNAAERAAYELIFDACGTTWTYTRANRVQEALDYVFGPGALVIDGWAPEYVIRNTRNDITLATGTTPIKALADLVSRWDVMQYRNRKEAK